MTTKIHLSGPADILTVLPYQLGFHPHDCLVVVSLHGTRVGLVQRIDLPPPEHVGEAVAAMIAPLRQDRPRSVLLIGFEEGEGDSRAMLDQMNQACGANNVRVDDRMVVRGGRWFDLDCHRSCCPPEGLELPRASEVPAVAEFVGREICPLPDRGALADLLEPTRIISEELSLLADEWSQLRQEAMDAGGSGRDMGDTEQDLLDDELLDLRASELEVWSRVLCDRDDAEPIQALPIEDLAILAASLTDVDLRDGLIAWLCPGSLPLEMIDRGLFIQLSEALPELRLLVGDVRDLDTSDLDTSDLDTRDLDRDGREQVIARQRIERRLCELCACLPDGWAVSTLTVLASVTWWRGDGALTRVALDRALRIDPSYRLALLLERMVDLAIRPARASA